LAATYQNFFKKLCGRPKLKKKEGRGSVHLTGELFQFQKGKDGITRLFIGSKTNNIGYLAIKSHKKYKQPKSLYIKKRHNSYWVSFCYELEENSIFSDKEHYKSLSQKGEDYLMQHTVGIDRGVARAVQTSLEREVFFDLKPHEKAHKTYLEARKKYYQKKLSRQKKGSNRRHSTKIRLSARHQSIANIRDNFCHQTSRKLVSRKNTQIIIFEDLGTKRMTRKPKPKKDNNGKFLPNKAKAKAGLNKSILDKNWYKLELYTKYKANNLGKAFFKIAPNHTSQECAHWHHIHPQHRKTPSQFQCVQCGHTDNADFNATKVIKLRAIHYLLTAGTELSKRGVLSLKDIGRGARVRHIDVVSTPVCTGKEASKEKVAPCYWKLYGFSLE